MLDDLKKELELIARTGRRNELSPTRRISGAIIEVRGRQVVDFTNWDFLGVAQHATVKRAAQSTIERSGIGEAANRRSSGTSAEIISAEARLAKFLGTESALILPSKNQGIFTLLGTLLGERDTVFVDDLVQAPIADAAFLVDASVQSIQSQEPTTVASELERARGSRRRVLFVEGISPVTGVPSGLPALSTQCAKHDTQLIVDESFSLGAIGVHGAGAIEASGVVPPFCIVGDLGQSLGLFGGFLAGSQLLISYLMERSRALGLDAPLPASYASAVEAALSFVELGHLAREELAKRTKAVNTHLRAGGVSVLGPLFSPVVSIRIANFAKAVELSRALFQRGYYTEALFPQVPFSEAAYLRLLITNRHTERQLESVAQAFIELVPRVLRK